MSADERRESVIRAAMVEFARGGYAGTSTDSIARRVGVSQPYLFRLFPGKEALFLAVAERCFDLMERGFRQAADGLHGVDALKAMGGSYDVLIRDRDVLLMQMQLYVAAANAEEGEVARYVRRRWLELWDMVRSLTGVDEVELNRFFGSGMLINALVALGIPFESPCWLGFSLCEVPLS